MFTVAVTSVNIRTLRIYNKVCMYACTMQVHVAACAQHVYTLYSII